MTEPEIIYEDNEILVLSKPSGLLVHDDGRSKEETLADWILKHRPGIQTVGEPAKINGKLIARPGIVHRLDRDTSGVMVVAKTDASFTRLKRAFAKQKIKKQYIAIVYGNIKKDRVIIDTPIGMHRGGTRKSAALSARGVKREAETSFRVVARSKEASYVEAFPKTGRTHQIRAHLEILGHPVVCDPLYAPGRPCLFGIDRLALHAQKITIPVAGDNVKEFTVPPPRVFEKALEYIQNA